MLKRIVDDTKPYLSDAWSLNLVLIFMLCAVLRSMSKEEKSFFYKYSKFSKNLWESTMFLIQRYCKMTTLIPIIFIYPFRREAAKAIVYIIKLLKTYDLETILLNPHLLLNGQIFDSLMALIWVITVCLFLVIYHRFDIPTYDDIQETIYDYDDSSSKNSNHNGVKNESTSESKPDNWTLIFIGSLLIAITLLVWYDLIMVSVGLPSSFLLEVLVLIYEK